MNNEHARKNRLTSLIYSLEHIKLSFPLAVLSFFSIVFARAFLEGIFERGHTIGLHPITEISIYNVFLHFPVYYLFVFLAAVLFLHFITREKVENVSKILLTFLPIIIIPPLIDLFITPGRGDALFYFMEMKDFSKALYATFIPTVALRGVSSGIRIEVLIGCLLAMVYVAVKSGKWYKALLSFWGVYLILVLSGAIPILFAKCISLFSGSNAPVYEFAYRSGGLIPTETQRVTLIALLPLIILAPVVLYRWSRHTFKSMVHNAGNLSSLHFLIMTSLGFVLASLLIKDTGAPLIINPLDYIAMFGLLVAILLAYQAMILFEKAAFPVFAEQKINGSESRRGIATQASMLLVSSLIIALSIHYVCFILVIAFALVFFFYLSPPFRFRRIFPFSTFLLSLASLVATLLGFSLFAGEKATFIFPPRLSLSLMVLFTLTFSLKDLASFACDKKAGYLTIPTTMGEKKGSIVVSLLVWIGLLSVPAILGEYLLFIPAILIAFAITLMILKHFFRKQLIVICYLVFLLSIIVALFRNKSPIANHSLVSFLAIHNVHAANCFMEKKSTGEALILYETALEEGYESPDLYRNLGVLYLKQGNAQKSVELLEKALAFNPYDQEARVLLAQALTRAGNFARALATCEKGAGSKHRAEFLMLKGDIFLATKEPLRALEAFKQSIRAGETTGNSYMAMGNILLSMDSLESAINSYTQAFNFMQESPVLKHRAEAYFRKGAMEASLSDLLAAEELDPRDPEIKNNIHYGKGDYHAAERYLLEAISLDRYYLMAYQNLSDTYKKIGQTEKAARVDMKINELSAKENKNG
jgi:tetratricopeptide (TPR) repeat protein/4-hydroxybenzoate polyprenyltransferase